MSEKITVLDRITKNLFTEKVYGESWLKALYGKGGASFLFGKLLLPIMAGTPLFSKLYGWMQKRRSSKKKIVPFIRDFALDTSEFLDSVEHFQSFNDFFIRKLKKEARPIALGRDVAILPADGRYLVYPDIARADGFLVKGKKFSLVELLQEEKLAQMYAEGAMVLARLCPVDYHRFHFPMNCLPSIPSKITGDLYSVNPLALRKRIEIFSENKREITFLQTKNFGQVLFLEIGATCVGTIHHTFMPNEPYAKGDEKGYFSFGGSSLILLFEPGRIQFDQDLVEASQDKIEVRGLMGQTLGRSLTP